MNKFLKRTKKVLFKAMGAGIFCASSAICLGAFTKEPTILELITVFGMLAVVFTVIMIPFAILTEI